MSKEIFKKYDVRGIVDEQLNEQVMQQLGYGFAKENNLQNCLVGQDIRKTSPAYAQAVIKGLRAAGCNVTQIGTCSTAQLKWAVGEEKLDAAMMITASHNPPNYNGIKFYLQAGTPYGEQQGMHELKNYLETTPPQKEVGTLQTASKKEAYTDFLHKHLPSNETPVFIDPSAGAACQELKALAKKGGYNWTLYNAEEDPQFSEHSPNPLDPEAYETAADWSSINNCISAVLDGDADRILFIDETGSLVPADYLSAWLAQELVKTGAISTVNASRALKKYCEENNKKYEQVAVGWIFVQNALAKHGFELGAEKSGHIFFKEAHNAEAPLLCLLYVLKLLNGKRLADVISPIAEQFHSSKEYNYKVNDREEVLKQAKKHFAEHGELDETDGVLIESNDFWLSLRASNTEPLIRVTWEATNQETYTAVKELLNDFIKPYTA